MEIATIRGAVARGWCRDANRLKEMDSDLAEAISQEVAALIQPGSGSGGGIDGGSVI